MSDFGGKLRAAREGRGISLRQIAATTRISPAALEALERNDVSKLPGGIFSRAFVKSYASEVGLDPERTVQEFLDRFEGGAAADPVIESDASLRAERRRALALLAGVAALTLIGAAVVYFAYRNFGPALQAYLR